MGALWTGEGREYQSEQKIADVVKDIEEARDGIERP